MANFGHLQNPDQSTNCEKNCHSWLSPWDEPLRQFRSKFFQWGLLGNWVKYIKCLFTYLYTLSQTSLQQTLWPILTSDEPEEAKSSKGVPFVIIKINKSSSGDEIPERDVTYHLCSLFYHWTTTRLYCQNIFLRPNDNCYISNWRRLTKSALRILL